MRKTRIARITGALLVGGTMLVGTSAAAGAAEGNAEGGEVSYLTLEDCAFYGETLSRGSYGKCVSHVQEWLNTIYHEDLDVDGVYGRATQRAVYRFQERFDMPYDGIVGPMTWAALVEEKGYYERRHR